MEPDEMQEYQENEIDTALSNVNDRMEHLSGRVSRGILNGELIQEHQNRRLEAYLEGYADALEFAAHEIDSIQNMAKYLPDDALVPSNGGKDDG